MAKVCASCGAPLADNDLFCMKCGTPVDSKKDDDKKKKYCPQCGNVLAEGAMFCDVCGRETGKAKPKKEAAAPEEPAVMEGILSPTITEDTFAGSKDLSREKFDGFESADMSAIKIEDNQAMMPKAMPSFEMDSAALPERKKEEPKPQASKPPQKKEVTAESIRSSNPYGEFAAKSGGKTIQTARENKPAEKPASAPKPELKKEAPAPQPAEQPQPQPEQTAAPAKSGGFAGFIDKIKSIFTKK